MSQRQRRILYGTLLCIVLACLYGIFVLLVEPFTGTQNAITDRLLPGREGNPNVVVAAIDDASLDSYGAFGEWSRGLHADAVENLTSAGARVIAFDLLLIEDDPEGDPALAAAIEESGRVVLAVAGNDPAARQDDGPLVFQSLLTPVEEIADAGAPTGHVNFPADADGIVRRVPLVIDDDQGEDHLALSLAAFLHLFGQPAPTEVTGDSIEVVERSIPVDDRARMLINFAGGAEAFNTMSYGDVIAGDFDPELVRNKTVFVGVTFTGAGDVHRAPNVAGGLTPGVYLQANALDTMLEGRFLEEVSPPTNVLVFIALAAILALVLPRAPVWVGAAAAIGLVGAHEIVGFFLFDRGTVINFVWTPVGLGLVFIAALGHRAWLEREHRDSVSALFGRYVSPQIATALIERADRGQLDTEGELREVSVIFADLRNFTALSEVVPPHDMMNILNRCFATIVDRINAHGGTVTKFGGDAVMAIWNAPEEQPDHAAEACRAVWESLQGLEDIYGEHPEIGESRFGFGINTGMAVAGNLGGRGRSEYTLIGDAVNTASASAAAPRAARPGSGHGPPSWPGAASRLSHCRR